MKTMYAPFLLLCMLVGVSGHFFKPPFMRRRFFPFPRPMFAGFRPGFHPFRIGPMFGPRFAPWFSRGPGFGFAGGRRSAGPLASTLAQRGFGSAPLASSIAQGGIANALSNVGGNNIGLAGSDLARATAIGNIAGSVSNANTNGLTVVDPFASIANIATQLGQAYIANEMFDTRPNPQTGMNTATTNSVQEIAPEPMVTVTVQEPGTTGSGYTTNTGATASGYSGNTGTSAMSGYTVESRAPAVSGYTANTGIAPGSGYTANTGAAAVSGYTVDTGAPAGSAYTVDTGAPVGSAYTVDTGAPAGSAYTVDTGAPVGSGYTVDTGAPVGSAYTVDTGAPVGSAYTVDTGSPAGSGYTVDTGAPAGSAYTVDTGAPAGSGYTVDTGAPAVSAYTIDTGAPPGSGYTANTGAAAVSGYTVDTGSPAGSAYTVDTGAPAGSSYTVDTGAPAGSAYTVDTGAPPGSAYTVDTGAPPGSAYTVDTGAPVGSAYTVDTGAPAGSGYTTAAISGYDARGAAGTSQATDNKYYDPSSKTLGGSAGMYDPAAVNSLLYLDAPSSPSSVEGMLADKGTNSYQTQGAASTQSNLPASKIGQNSIRGQSQGKYEYRQQNSAPNNNAGAMMTEAAGYSGSSQGGNQGDLTASTLTVGQMTMEGQNQGAYGLVQQDRAQSANNAGSMMIQSAGYNDQSLGGYPDQQASITGGQSYEVQAIGNMGGPQGGIISLNEVMGGQQQGASQSGNQGAAMYETGMQAAGDMGQMHNGYDFGAGNSYMESAMQAGQPLFDGNQGTPMYDTRGSGGAYSPDMLPSLHNENQPMMGYDRRGSNQGFEQMSALPGTSISQTNDPVGTSVLTVTQGLPMGSDFPQSAGAGGSVNTPGYMKTRSMTVTM